MDDQPAQQDPKISLVEIILIGAFLLLIDAIEIAIVLFALDDFWILDLIASSIFFYLLIKGVPPMRQFVCWLVELIPWVGALPLLTIGLALTVWADRHPSGALAKAGALAGTLKGKKMASAGAAKTKGVGARSLARMERSEKRAGEWKAQVDEKLPFSSKGRPSEFPAQGEGAAGTRPSTLPPISKRVDGIGTGNGQPAGVAQDAETGKQPGQKISKEAFGEKPTPFEELERLTQKTPMQEEAEGEEEEDEEYDKAA